MAYRALDPGGYYSGNNAIDFANANNWLGTKGIPGLTINSSNNPVINGITYTWHHHQDCKTLMLVEQEIHQASVPHAGKAFLDYLKDFTFSSPF